MRPADRAADVVGLANPGPRLARVRSSGSLLAPTPGRAQAPASPALIVPRRARRRLRYQTTARRRTASSPARARSPTLTSRPRPTSAAFVQAEAACPAELVAPARSPLANWVLAAARSASGDVPRSPMSDMTSVVVGRAATAAV